MSSMRFLHLPLTLEEQAITRINAIVQPRISFVIGSDKDKNEMYQEIETTIWELSQELVKQTRADVEEELKEKYKQEGVMNTLRQVADWDSEMGEEHENL